MMIMVIIVVWGLGPVGLGWVGSVIWWVELGVGRRNGPTHNSDINRCNQLYNEFNNDGKS